MRTFWTNGRFYTMDRQLPVADTVVTQGDRILAVGWWADVETIFRAGDRKINLEGRTVVPGLIDAHVHFTWYSFGLFRVNLDGVDAVAEAVGRLGARAATLPPGAWVHGAGFNPNLFGRWPTKEDLDRVSPDRPVAVTSKDGHSLWCNSAALRMAGISADTPDPTGGVLLRDQHGEPTGVLQENAMNLVYRVQPAPTVDDHVTVMREGMRAAHAQGVTGLHDKDHVASFQALQTLLQRGELTLRVTKSVPEDALAGALTAGLMSGFGNEWLRIGYLKLFSDGALGSQTAHMLAPYEGRPGYHGVSVHSYEEMHDLVGRSVRGNLAVAIHAIGDAANRTVLDVFAAHQAESVRRGLRHRLEHAQLLHPDDLPRLAELGVIASVQPSHAPSDRYTADRHWGARCSGAYAFRSLLDSGAVLALGSDAPVEPLDPLAGIHAAVARKRMDEPDSEPWYPLQRLTVEEALRGFTLGAAYASGEEGLKGSLVPGKLADMVVLTHDLMQGDEETLRAVRPVCTIVGGRPVWGEVG